MGDLTSLSARLRHREEQTIIEARAVPSHLYSAPLVILASSDSQNHRSCQCRHLGVFLEIILL
jgi:hypothetical protein